MVTAQQIKRGLGAACSYAYVRLAMNDYTYCGEALSEDFPHGVVDDLADDFHSALGKYLDGTLSLDEIGDLRKRIVERMMWNSTYADCFQAYEYVLNRIEGRFTPKLVPKKDETAEAKSGASRIQGHPADPETTAEDILACIRDHKQLPVMNYKIHEVLGQLPVRLTKKKFFSMVDAGLSMCLDLDRGSLDGIIEAIRWEGLLNEPQRGEKGYEEAFALLNRCRETDYSKLDAQTYRRLSESLSQICQFLEKAVWCLAAVMNLANDLYLICLTRQHVLMDASEEAHLLKILRKDKELFDSLHTASDKDFEEAEKIFPDLEGKQEAYYEQWDRFIGGAGKAARKRDSSLGEILRQADLLMSDNVFISLDVPETETARVTRELITQLEEELFRDLSDSWEKQPKVVVRACMAKILARIPFFFRSADELKDYVAASLASCEDEVERAASINLIYGILNEEFD